MPSYISNNSLFRKDIDQLMIDQETQYVLDAYALMKTLLQPYVFVDVSSDPEQKAPIYFVSEFTNWSQTFYTDNQDGHSIILKIESAQKTLENLNEFLEKKTDVIENPQQASLEAFEMEFFDYLLKNWAGFMKDSVFVDVDQNYRQVSKDSHDIRIFSKSKSQPYIEHHKTNGVFYLKWMNERND